MDTSIDSKEDFFSKTTLLLYKVCLSAFNIPTRYNKLILLLIYIYIYHSLTPGINCTLGRQSVFCLSVISLFYNRNMQNYNSKIFYCKLKMRRKVTELGIHIQFNSIQFSSVYWPIKGPQGATGKLYTDE